MENKELKKAKRRTEILLSMSTEERLEALQRCEDTYDEKKLLEFRKVYKKERTLTLWQRLVCSWNLIVKGKSTNDLELFVIRNLKPFVDPKENLLELKEVINAPPIQPKEKASDVIEAMEGFKPLKERLKELNVDIETTFKEELKDIKETLESEEDPTAFHSFLHGSAEITNLEDIKQIIKDNEAKQKEKYVNEKQAKNGKSRKSK